MDTEPAPPEIKSVAPARDNTRNLGMSCHLLALVGLTGVPFGNVLGPLIMWLIKREESSFIDACGKESVNFQISALIYFFGIMISAFILMFMPFIGVLFLGLAIVACFALFVADLIFVVIASIKASEGVIYEYPLSIRLIK